MVELKFKKLNQEAIIPKYETPGSAGMDLSSVQSGTILAGQQSVIKTGLAVAVPEGCEMQIRPRSGLAAKKSITVTNSPGTIDSDYRGEIMVILRNDGNSDFKYTQGDRIAQAVIAPVIQAVVVETLELDDTERGEGGLGSTGTNVESN